MVIDCPGRTALAMAEYAGSTSFIELHSWRSCVKQRGFVPQRKYFPGSSRVVQLSTWKMHGAGFLNLKASPCFRRTSLMSSCLGSLVDLDVAAASDWVSVSDQLLLMTSIFLTYMAGVIPLEKSNFTSRKKMLDDGGVSEISTSSGSDGRNDDCINLNCAWDNVKAKLLASLDAMEHRTISENRILESEQNRAKLPLSLCAVSEGPKLRLLWASFQQLQQEVNNILSGCESVNMDDWLALFPEIVRRSCHITCKAWLVEEIRLENEKSNEELVSLMVDKFKGDDSLLQNVRKSGKEDLYAELLHFLRFGPLRRSYSYDNNLFILHGDSILEDLVITLADGIASVYLELISVDGNLSNEINNSLGMDMCNLSTRALQRLRNEVALNQWLYQNLEAVVSIYEDRFDLCTLQLKVIEEKSPKQNENHSLWRKLILSKSGARSSSSCYIVINQFSVPVKRVKELKALTGWRYYFSLYLELSDITMPFIRAVIDKVSNAISFFLVSLIGQSLGLIYTGIRQSLRWK